jgi:hypothetical protein
MKQFAYTTECCKLLHFIAMFGDLAEGFVLNNWLASASVSPLSLCAPDDPLAIREPHCPRVLGPSSLQTLQYYGRTTCMQNFQLSDRCRKRKIPAAWT